MSLKDICILYIDDDQDTIDIILDDLKSCVHKISLAQTQGEALEKFKSEKFDLIIISINLRKEDGFKVLTHLRKVEPDIHAIVLMEDCTKEFAKGMSDINILNDYISKTQSIRILNKFIRKSIEKTLSRRNFKEAYALLGHYKEALDESWLVFKTDLEGNITYVNNNFSNISLYNADEILGQNFSILSNDTAQKEILEDLWQTIQNKKVFKSELKLNKKGGDYFYVKTTIIPVMDTYQEVLEYISISFDITELKNSLKRAQDARKAKSAFLANMSHDIRVPLNGILGFSRLLKSDNLAKKEEHQYIDIINQSASTLLGIINEILDISKIESRKLKLENSFFDPAYEFEIITELFSSLTHEKNIDYILYLDPKLPKKLYGDVLRIKQIMANLISNAIKFTPKEGKIMVEVRVLSLSNTCFYQICVSDTGIGIEKNNQENIFEPFEQANSSIGKRFGGTGLGLSISHNVLELMNSEFYLESEVNEGSSFSFVLESKYELENIVYDKKVQKLNVVFYEKDQYDANKHIQITQDYMSKYCKTSITENLDTLNNDETCDILVMMYQDFENFKTEKFPCPLLIIHNNTIEIQTLNTPYRILRTPINPAKTYDNILDLLGIQNSKTSPLQKKLRNENTLFSGNVLVAEDDETSQQLIQIILESKGVTVKTVNDGEKAVDYVTQLHQDSSLDFILMDINMPITNGIDATKEIKDYETKNNVKHTPIIAFTANAITGDKEKYLKLGMDDYLSKPIQYPDLYNILDEYLKRSTPLIHDTPEKKTQKANSLKYSLEESAQLVGLSTDKFSVIFKKFVNNFDAKLSALKSHIKEGNHEELTRSAHSLKGASGNMNITPMYEIFKDIELSSREKITSTYNAELDKIQNIHSQLEEILKNTKIP